MNIFLPQSNQTQIELEEIVDVQKQLITPATSTPIMGMVQDGLLASYNLTQPTMKIDWKSAMNIISYTTFDDLSSFKKEDIQGTDLFSLILPAKINTFGDLEVKNGKIMKGHLSSKSLGLGKPHNLVHLMWNQYGPLKTRIFLNDIQRLFNNFNLWNGFSVGIGDIDIPIEVEKQIHTLIETKKLEVDHLITEMENYPDLIPIDVFESTIKAELDTIRSTAGKNIIENLKPSNNFSIMSDQKAGSKGNVDNIAQMIACIGQQGVEGKRIQKKFNGRSIAYCHQHDDSALGRGFCEQPFCKGVHPTSFIFHNMASREGLIDTAIKSVTGDTEIIIIESNIIKHIKIGDWIDNLIDKSNDVEHYKERDMELLKLEHQVYIPTTDELGNVSWGDIKAITRHDPGNELYEIQTQSGRKVIVTESKSLLIWNNVLKQFERMSTVDVKIGDYVPVTINLPKPPIENIDDSDNDLNVIIADNETIIKLLAKYIIKYGTICVNYIQIKPPAAKNSSPLDISMMLSRLGIFSKVNDISVSIYGSHAIKLANSVSFPSSLSQYFDIDDISMQQNDVILDEIIEINKIDVNKYPKVYDLTIPSTLNFGLANGLHVVDTAESGYVQRKLIKAAEDISVKYDSTVRNSNNTIIQFVYGDNGIDTTKQAYYNLNMLEMSNATVATKIRFTDQELKNFDFTESDNKKFYESVLKLRNKLRVSRMATSMDNITFENGFMLPVNVKNIITNIRNNNKIKDEGKLDPRYVLDGLKNILDYKNTKVTSMNQEEYNNKKCLRHKDEMLAKSSFKFALYEHLSPKICIFDHGFNKTKFDKVCEKIIEAFNLSVVEAGEMVGIIAAQSIGEPTTQIVRIKCII